jgi:hypothetical protein
MSWRTHIRKYGTTACHNIIVSESLKKKGKYEVLVGGGLMISILELSEVAFKNKVFNTPQEALRSARQLQKEWENFLKSKGIEVRKER